MIRHLRKQRLALITVVYWFLLLFIIAAWIWWFISLGKQNDQMLYYRTSQLDKNDPAYDHKYALIADEHKRKTAQYISEGVTFILVTLVGAVFVYRAARKQIRLSNQQRNFMMAVTHELKTPIAVTQLNLETLNKRKLDEQQQHRLISNALEETNRLNTLTNNILVAAQLESGNYSINKQPTDLSAIVNESIAGFQKRYPESNLISVVENDIQIEGEVMLLQMLTNNLVENAIKYSGKANPIQIQLEKKSDKVFLKIIDSGPGISNAEKKKIFEKFYRSGDEFVRTSKGTGLGLYLCKKIVTDHKGEITVSDNHPTGAIFTVSLNAL